MTEALLMVSVELGAPADEAWAPKDLVDLDWALSRIADAERQQAELRRVAEEVIARARLKAEILSERLEKEAAYFRSRVATYAETHRAELLGNGKRRSRTLLHGTIGWRKTGGGLEVTDREALLDWARAQPVELGCLRIKEEPALTEIKKHCATTGEVPPGCDVSPDAEEFTIKAVSEVGGGE